MNILLHRGFCDPEHRLMLLAGSAAAAGVGLRREGVGQPQPSFVSSMEHLSDKLSRVSS